VASDALKAIEVAFDHFNGIFLVFFVLFALRFVGFVGIVVPFHLREQATMDGG
jgi:hypothetical protein